MKIEIVQRGEAIKAAGRGVRHTKITSHQARALLKGKALKITLPRIQRIFYVYIEWSPYAKDSDLHRPGD